MCLGRWRIGLPPQAEGKAHAWNNLPVVLNKQRKLVEDEIQRQNDYLRALQATTLDLVTQLLPDVGEQALLAKPPEGEVVTDLKSCVQSCKATFATIK